MSTATVGGVLYTYPVAPPGFAWGLEGAGVFGLFPTPATLEATASDARQVVTFGGNVETMPIAPPNVATGPGTAPAVACVALQVCGVSYATPMTRANWPA